MILYKTWFINNFGMKGLVNFYTKFGTHYLMPPNIQNTIIQKIDLRQDLFLMILSKKLNV